MSYFFNVIFNVAVSFAIAVLSGLGIGSGGLFVIFVTAVYGVSVTQARGMNLLFFVFSASSALLFHFAGGRIELPLIIRLSLFSLIGTLLGTHVATYIEPTLLRKLFGIFLVLCGAYTIISTRANKRI